VTGGARWPGLVDALRRGPGATAKVILERQPAGTLIVDADTVVRFANPAAAALLGVPAQRLVGQTFGFPVIAGDVTDLNVPDEGGSVRTLAMRVTPLEEPGRTHLVTLFDVTWRARAYEHEHRLVESLQRSILLDRMPVVPGATLAARYLPGGGEARVGGDWYDAIPLADGRLGLAIGDVAGHGIESAALMGQLRNAVRAYALEHDSPAAVLERLDDMLRHLEPDQIATMVYLVYEPQAGTLTFASAGHPYPLLARPDADGEFLRHGQSLPLGAGIARARDHSTIEVPAGSLLLLYTDGLIERRTRSLDAGLSLLAETVRASPPDPEAACDAILEQLLHDEPATDDVAMLAMRAGAP
jgi:serine phosphatase RsbU (regulator of sigma subunit)